MVRFVDGMVVARQIVVDGAQLSSQIVSLPRHIIKILPELLHVTLHDHLRILRGVEVASQIQIPSIHAGTVRLKLATQALKLIIYQVLLIYLITQLIIETHVVSLEVAHVFLASSHFFSHLLCFGEGFAFTCLGIC